MHSDALQNTLQHLGDIKVRQRGSFSYEVSDTGSDLREQIKKLRAMRNSPYWHRSEADIAGMILLEHVPKEIDKYERQAGQSEG